MDRKAIDEADILKEEMFYSPEHQFIFRAIKTLHNERKPIDFNTVIEQLKSFKRLDDAGGVMKLVELTGRVGSTAHAGYYAGVIFDKWYARELIRISSNIIEGAYSNLDIDTLRANLDGEIIKLDDVDNSYSLNLDEVIHEVKTNLRQREMNRRRGIKTCVETPFDKLNEMLNGGFHHGDLVILAARPGLGKTKFASEFGEHFAKDSAGAFISLEMTIEQLVLRMFVKEGASMRCMMTGDMREALS